LANSHVLRNFALHLRTTYDDITSNRTQPLKNKKIHMLHIKLSRYYGNRNVTKSRFLMYYNDELVLECEARELGYKDYEEVQGQRGISYFCMQRGQFKLTFSHAPGNPVCLRLTGVIHHRGLKIYCDEANERCLNAILIGYANENVPMERRKLERVKECKELFQKLMYKHYQDKVDIEVTNDEVVYDSLVNISEEEDV